MQFRTLALEHGTSKRSNTHGCLNLDQLALGTVTVARIISRVGLEISDTPDKGVGSRLQEKLKNTPLDVLEAATGLRRHTLVRARRGHKVRAESRQLLSKAIEILSSCERGGLLSPLENRHLSGSASIWVPLMTPVAAGVRRSNCAWSASTLACSLAVLTRSSKLTTRMSFTSRSTPVRSSLWKPKDSTVTR